MVQAATPTGSILSQYWQWRDQTIHYVKVGQPQAHRPPLLLVHGFGASTDHWRKNLLGLCQDFEVWAIDLLGFGRSAKPDLAYSGELWRDQLYAFVQEVIGQPTVLSGNSLGGYASLCVAAHHPEAVSGLILLNSAGPFSDTQSAPPASPLRELISRWTQILFRQDWASFLLFQYVRQKSVIRKTLEKVYLDQSAITEQLVEDIYRPSCDVGAPQVFASVFRTPQGQPVDYLLKQMACPLLLIWGEADPWINARDRGARFREHYPDLTEHYLRAGHCPHDEVPDQVNHLIREWILQITGQP